MFALANITVSAILISCTQSPYPTMQPDSLTPVAERILYTVWKLNAIGSRFVFEEAVKSELSIPAEEFREEMERLQEQVFINTQKIDGKASLSLTPLGLAILRQAEEDSLQELR